MNALFGQKEAQPEAKELMYAGKCNYIDVRTDVGYGDDDDFLTSGLRTFCFGQRRLKWKCILTCLTKWRRRVLRSARIGSIKKLT